MLWLSNSTRPLPPTLCLICSSRRSLPQPSPQIQFLSHGARRAPRPEVERASQSPSTTRRGLAPAAAQVPRRPPPRSPAAGHRRGPRWPPEDVPRCRPPKSSALAFAEVLRRRLRKSHQLAKKSLP
ncbi:unnamed protein product [Urochloa humidicola]